VISAADDNGVRRTVPLVAPLAVAVVALLGAAGPGTVPAPPAAAVGSSAPAPSPQELSRLQAALEGATEEATRLADALQQAAARDGGLRVQLDRLAEQQEAAQRHLDAQARAAYLATTAHEDPLGGLVVGLASPDLRGLARAELARRGAAARVRAAEDLVHAAGAHSAAAEALHGHASAYREGLRGQAEAALAAQDAARRLLVEAAAARARAAEAATLETQLARARAALDTASAATTTALTPAQTRRSQKAAAREAPLVALAEAAGSAYPAGYGPSGTVLRGVASWYGPGFVGNPTASGAPYDPERLTCAHTTLQLGTLVRVSRDGRAISCLVNDRGPYVGDRILDLSRAGSRALGFDGVAPVVVEVLAPVS
jgi:rare lipoprotein A